MDCGVIKTNEKGNRYVEATRDIKAGEVIIQEDALMSGPHGDPFPFPICLSCYRAIVWEPNYCNTCKWAMCDEKCEKAAIHAKMECRIFKNAGVKAMKDEKFYFYVMVLRCLLLRELNAKKFESLMQLWPNPTGGKKAKLVPPPHVSEFIQKKCNKKEFDLETIAMVCKIIELYSYGTTDRLAMTAAPRYACLLFFNAGSMSHDCRPNSTWSRVENSDNSISIKVWATVDIKSGRKITTQYFGTLKPNRLYRFKYITRPHIERRFHLQDVYNIVCDCSRCDDPKDLGTYYCSIRCTRCPKGFMLSTKMLKGSDAEFKCEKCKFAQPYRDCVVPIETTVFEAIAKCQEEADYEKILKEHSGKTFHQNHWLMMDCRQQLVNRMYGFVGTIKPVEEMQKRAEKMLQYCEALKIIIDAFYPGQNRIQARHQLYTRYAKSLTKGESEEIDAEVESVCEIIKNGDEMSIFLK